MMMVMMMATMDGAAALGQRGRLVRGFEIVLTVRPCRIGLVGNVDIRHGSLGDRLPAHSGGFGRKRACGIKLCSLARSLLLFTSAARGAYPLAVVWWWR